MFDPNGRMIAHKNLNNDLIAINDSSVAVDILSKYKSKILSQKEMCGELLKYLTLIISELGNCIPHMLKEKEEMTEKQEKNKIEKMMKEMINKKEDAESYVKDLRDYRIAVLYERDFLPFLITLGLNLGKFNIVRVVDCKLVG
ncbi:hypothetical protein wTpre_540 [Wolbachia endosymbiont of Trichogramma pretiosum]|nr:hypothetical protein [Wolbachia endosymbiont of Trichogramma pretiosum]OCA06215.1 hypothetical protein wTpre_540 [Wolbachia endosymbiont of Trichogramma pretiosum]